MNKENYSEEEMKKIIETAEKIQDKEKHYSKDEIIEMARNKNISANYIKKAVKMHKASHNKKRKKKTKRKLSKIKIVLKILLYLIYFAFWTIFILLLVNSSNYKNSWIWVVPSITLITIILGAFMMELEGAFIGLIAGAVIGVSILFLSKVMWGQILIASVFGFIAFLSFLFKIKENIDKIFIKK